LDRPGDRLDESLFCSRGWAAAVWCIGTVHEGRQAELPHLDRALSVLGELAFAEAKKAEAASEEMWEDLKRAKGTVVPLPVGCGADPPPPERKQKRQPA
jgi:hypothetical protein